MRAARANGLGIIIVSDTYLSEPQLRRLIGETAGEEALGLIDRIICSSEHGLSKGEGLFKPVLKALGFAPAAIPHVGDNIQAYQVAPQHLGQRGRAPRMERACEKV